MDPLGPGEHAPELLADQRASEAVRDGGELGPEQPDDGDEVPAPPPGHRGAEQAEALHPPRVPQADFDRHPAAERVADKVSPLDPHRVHEPADGAREPGGVVRSAERLGRRAEPRQVDGVDRVLGREAETVSKKLVLLLPSPWMRITVSMPSPAVSVEIRALPAFTSWMRSSGGRPNGRWKKPSKATARSRLPLAHSRRERKASRPERPPSRSSSQVAASVPITTSGSRSGETGPGSCDRRARPPSSAPGRRARSGSWR